MHQNWKAAFFADLVGRLMLFLGNKWNKQFFVGRSGERKGGEPSLFFFTMSWLSQNCNMAGFVLRSFFFNLYRHLFFISLCCVTPDAGQFIWIRLWAAYKQSREKNPQLLPDTSDTKIIKVGTVSSTHMSETVYTRMFWLLQLAESLAQRIILAWCMSSKVINRKVSYDVRKPSSLEYCY